MLPATDDIFSRKTVFVAAFGIVAFLLALGMLMKGERGAEPGDIAGANTFSRSAVGHGALFELLKTMGVPVLRTRLPGGRAAGQRDFGRDSFVVVAEPQSTEAADTARRGFQGKPLVVLFVLPKRKSVRARRDGFSSKVQLIPVQQVDRTMSSLGLQGEVIRTKRTQNSWSTNALQATPSVEHDLQLIRSGELEPLVATADGILLGVSGSLFRRVYLSDPDVMANHGLDDGQNAAFMVELLETLRMQGSPIIFDETVHGFMLSPSFWRELLEFPGAAVTLSLLGFTLVLGWLALSRFGKPALTKEALVAGNEQLIYNMARVLGRGGVTDFVLERYARHTLRSIAGRRRLPAASSLPEQINNLRLHAKTDREFALLDVIEGELNDKTGRRKRALTIARQLHTLRQGMNGGA